jgi:hypothetical protein
MSRSIPEWPHRDAGADRGAINCYQEVKRMSKSIQLILFIIGLLLASENPHRLDMDMLFFNQFNQGKYDNQSKTINTVLAQGASVYVGYKLINNFIVGFTGSSPMGNHRVGSESWTLSYPSCGAGVFFLGDNTHEASLLTDIACGLQAGYWIDGFVPSGASTVYFNETEFKTEYYGGPLLNLSVGLKNISLICKAAVNLGVKSKIIYTYENDPRYSTSREFTSSFDLSIGLRYSLYPGKGLPESDEPFELRRNAFFLELLGVGYVWSVNYEYIAFNHVAIRSGLSYFFTGDNNHFLAPVSLTYLLGSGNFRMEYGAGYPINITPFYNLPNAIFPICGIRFQSDKSGLIWRIAYTPWFPFKVKNSYANTDITQWLSTSIGYSL